MVIVGLSLRSTLPGVGDLVTELNRAGSPKVPTPCRASSDASRAPPCSRLGAPALLVCPVRADLNCGAVTGHLDIGQDDVSWADWRWDNSHEPPELSMGYTVTLEPTGEIKGL